MKALHVNTVTLVGFSYSQDPPYPRGNCFSVQGEDGSNWKILNFHHENLEALEQRGLTWPIDIEPVGWREAVIMDKRIGERWYDSRFCEICCPRYLLPITQQQAIEREYLRGQRVNVTDKLVRHNFKAEVAFP